jgi:Ca2+-binding RTX toxin-like protein
VLHIIRRGCREARLRDKGGKRVRRTGLKVVVVGALLLVLSAAVALAAINGGTTGGDTISGTDGTDYLFGQDGNDTISGQAGNDQIFGGDGDDDLRGNSGGDTIVGGPGADAMYMGQNAYRDFVDAADNVTDTVIDCGGRADNDRIPKDPLDPVANCPGVSTEEKDDEFIVN